MEDGGVYGEGGSWHCTLSNNTSVGLRTLFTTSTSIHKLSMPSAMLALCPKTPTKNRKLSEWCQAAACILPLQAMGGVHGEQSVDYIQKHSI